MTSDDEARLLEPLCYELEGLIAEWEGDLYGASEERTSALRECQSDLRRFMNDHLRVDREKKRCLDRARHILFLDDVGAHVYDIRCGRFAEIGENDLPSELHAIIVEGGVPMIDFTPEVVLALECIPTAWGRYSYLEDLEMALHGEEGPVLYLVT